MGFYSLLLLIAFSYVPFAQSACTANTNPAGKIKPVVTDGWKWSVVASGLNRPRSIAFDSRGRLIVLEAGLGYITSIELTNDPGVCVKEKSRSLLRGWGGLNHGLAFSEDRTTLYASTSDVVYSWEYDDFFQTLSDQKILVNGMENADHSTRTVLKSTFDDNMLLVSRGSNANIDPEAAYLSSGRSQLKAFDLSKVPKGGYDFTTKGKRLGWGLRNSVGVGEHPVTGGIFSVENSVDNFVRDNKDIHESNPGEELNYHGTLKKNVYKGQGGTYGYPGCFSAWNVSDLPNNKGLRTGSPFAADSSIDEDCQEVTIAPRLTFEAHTAPLDIKFNTGGSGRRTGQEAWITFHGSWNRNNPAGYLVGIVEINKSGQPVQIPSSRRSVFVVLKNADNSKCPNDCFRPVGMAFDRYGRLFFSSDRSGEIYVIDRDDDDGA